MFMFCHSFVLCLTCYPACIAYYKFVFVFCIVCRPICSPEDSIKDETVVDYKCLVVLYTCSFVLY